MKSPRGLWVAIAILIIWLILTWFLGAWIGLKAPPLYYLRGGLWIIGIAGFVGYLLLRPKEDGKAAQASGDPGTEIDDNFAEAARRLKAARGIRQLGSLPAIFVFGDTGSAKTNVIAKSGLEPELLAGHAYQDYVIAPTRTINLWFARNTLFVDPAGNVISDTGARKKLFKRFLPVRLNAVLAGKSAASRAVVFTVGCETFLQAGGAEALAAKARQFHSILTELSQELGSGLPVYVLFTKADKIAYFRDFVENFTEGETAEIFGTTLPMERGEREGVYAEQQMRRLTDAFQQLYYSLCDWRPIYLARGHDPSKLPNIYEFPREFAKLRSLLVQFLIDLGRPSQLGASPFLRGFYFTGVRPVTVTDLAPAAAHPAPALEQPFDAGATRIFNPRSQGGGVTALPQDVGTRKLPQWVFLTHLFSDVILSDRPASALARSNVKINLARRALLLAGSALALLMAVWWLISYKNNRALVHDAVEAAQEGPSTAGSSGQLASFQSLQRLTRMKNTLAKIETYKKHGVPLSYDALLYAGNSIREPLRVAYYALFRKLLLSPTQDALVSICGRPDAYGNDYRYVYDSLKAYLITTDHHEKSTPAFLTPVLLLHWQQNQQAAGDQQNLARENFDFYAADLARENLYPVHSGPDANTVATAQEYLKKFGQQETIYQAMLDAAGKGHRPIVFNDDYPGTQDTVRNRYSVPAAFSKAGYDSFAKQSQHPKEYFNGEDWVLGEKVNTTEQDLTLKQSLTTRYNQDFVKTWQGYLNATSIAGYQSVPDAVNKLDKLSSPGSALLRVLCVASENTSEDKDVAQLFQPPQIVTPPGCSAKLIGDKVNPYMSSLINLKGALQAAAAITPPDPASVSQAIAAATQAEGVASSLALNFASDSPVLGKTSQLLKDPITRIPPLVNALIRRGSDVAADGGAAQICAALTPLLNKYPFNQKSPTDVSIDELNGALKPQEGQVWLIVNTTLKPFVMLSGNEYLAVPNAPVTLTRQYLLFLNRLKHLTDALYKGSTLGFSFSMQPLAAPDVSHVTLIVDGQTFSSDLQAASSKTFYWPASIQDASLSVRFGAGGLDTQIGETRTGVWAIWHLLDTAEQPWRTNGSQYILEWISKTGAGPNMINGHPATVRFSLDPQGSPVFSQRYFGSIGCIGKAAQ